MDQFNIFNEKDQKFNEFKKLNEDFFYNFSEIFNLNQLIDYNLSMLSCNFLNINSIRRMNSKLMHKKPIEVIF